jgi:CRISPR/Cas system-associated endonuclease/helicase Cas3
MDINLQICPRFVRQDKDGFRPFQKATLEALQSKAQLIIVEAPVGAGKSYIIRRIVEDDRLSGYPTILTYPTKILMNAQINALKKEFPDIRHWPDEPNVSGELTLFEYSTDALIRYIRNHPEIIKLDKSEIIGQVLRSHQFLSKRNIMVTTPDVLHLIKKGYYRGSQRLEALLNKAIVVFDEFHLYTGLINFKPLVDWLVDSIAHKIILLSATPTSNDDIQSIYQKSTTDKIEFKGSIGGELDKIFNYPLHLHIQECKYTRTDVMLEQLRNFLPILPKPSAVIFDSIFRLRHLKPVLERELGRQWDIFEYSGMKKDNISFNEETVILGTASIEVGVEMPIKSLITEASYWTSAVQRLGRIGRLEKGGAVLLTRKRLAPYLKNREKLTRDELEQEVLKSALKETSGAMVSGEMFRGDSYPFIVIDKENNFVMPYTEAIFSMFDIDNDFVTNWQKMNQHQKRELLKEYRLSHEKIEDILLRDRIFQFFGVVKGRLKGEYENVTTKFIDNNLTVYLNNSGKTYYFDHGEISL